MKSRRILIFFLVWTLFFASACDSTVFQRLSETSKPPETYSEAAKEQQALGAVQPSSSAPVLPVTEVDFRVQIPENTPTTDSIYLTLLDEVTGLYLNARSYPLTLDTDSGIFSTRLQLPVGSLVKYRYERQGDQLRVAEHISDGSPVRYRMLAIFGPVSTEDVVGRWTDTEYLAASGRIAGRATDAATGQGIPNLLVSAGGAQAFTTSDGSFLIEGLPPGIHNLVGYALDGSYHIFQQGAEVAADSTTPAPISLLPASLVKLTFEVSVPANTPPVIVPIRMAGNLSQLGNTFGTLTGGVSVLASRMPVLTPLADGRYQLTLQLPAGAYIQYKYTIGDGYWNAEHGADGAFLLRQLIVPEEDTTIQDVVATWETNPGETLTFDVTAPANTPDGDFVSIQLNPLFGWTEPIPMWSLGGNRWAYVLYSPLNLPGNLSYRYCRNNQCGQADDVATPGLYGQGKTINLDQLPQQFKENITGWVGLDQAVDPALVATPVVLTRSAALATGVEFSAAFHPSWQPLLPKAIERIRTLGANWLVIQPTWQAMRANPPVYEVTAGRDPNWSELVSTIETAHEQGLKVALRPSIAFPGPAPTCEIAPCPTPADLWWQAATRDYSWWFVWFEHYKSFLLHHADMASQAGVDTLILGGKWLNPALPNGVLFDGSPSGVLLESEDLWRKLISEVRQRYTGQVAWGMSYREGQILPPFLDAVDQVYLDWLIPAASPDEALPTIEDLTFSLGQVLDGRILEIQTAIGKPLTLVTQIPSEHGLDWQALATNALLEAINQRDWIAGVVTGNYYPAAQIQDASSSVHGKPAEAVWQAWYLAWQTNQP